MFVISEQEDEEDEWEDSSEIDAEMDGIADAHNAECSTECSHDVHGYMDVTETEDTSLSKLHMLLNEFDFESIFPPLDGTALFSMLCKINHSCEPNVRVKYVFTKELGLTAFLVALKEISVGSELLQSYIDETMGTFCSIAFELFPYFSLILNIFYSRRYSVSSSCFS